MHGTRGRGLLAGALRRGEKLDLPHSSFCVTQVPEAGQQVRDLKVKAGMQRAPLEDTLNVTLPQQTRPEPHKKAGVFFSNLQSSKLKLA